MKYYLVACAVTLLLVYAIRQIRTYNALKHFGGPPGSGFSRLWLLRATFSGEMNHRFTAVNNKYGDTARIGPKFLLTRDPTLIRRMNAVRSTYTRAEWYNGLRLHPTRDNISSFRDEVIHNQLRSQMSHGYSGKENPGLEDDIDERVIHMLDLIRSKYVSTEQEYRPLDLARIVTYFTLDTISSVAFGKRFGFLDQDDDPFGYQEHLHSFLPAIMFFAVFPEVQKIMGLPLMRKLAPKTTDIRGLGKVMGFSRDVVAERFGPKKITRQDMLGSFLTHGMTQEQLESETITQITAGSDSSATAIRMTLFLIVTTPQIYNTVMAELTIALTENKLTRPILKASESRQLPYLQACIKEGLRLYPPVSGLLAKETPPTGDTLNDLSLPAGISIGWNSYGLCRIPLFGPDVEIFRPERWLEGGGRTKEERAEMEEVVGMVFGYGRFGCLGKPVALLELDKAVAELLLAYEWQVAGPGRPFEETCIGFFLHTRMIFRVSERKRDGGA